MFGVDVNSSPWAVVIGFLSLILIIWGAFYAVTVGVFALWVVVIAAVAFGVWVFGKRLHNRLIYGKKRRPKRGDA